VQLSFIFRHCTTFTVKSKETNKTSTIQIIVAYVFYLPFIILWRQNMTLLIIYETILDQLVYQKYGPNLQKIATEILSFDLTSYIYWL